LGSTIAGTGVDIISVNRIASVIDRNGERFLARVFTAREREYCSEARAAERFAGRFAAKEAVLKALGTGLRGCRWRDIEILSGPAGRPEVRLSGGAARLAAARGISHFHLSIAHCREYAVAHVIAERSDPLQPLTGTSPADGRCED